MLPASILYLAPLLSSHLSETIRDIQPSLRTYKANTLPCSQVSRLNSWQINPDFNVFCHHPRLEKCCIQFLVYIITLPRSGNVILAPCSMVHEHQPRDAPRSCPRVSNPTPVLSFKLLSLVYRKSWSPLMSIITPTNLNIIHDVPAQPHRWRKLCQPGICLTLMNPSCHAAISGLNLAPAFLSPGWTMAHV